ncbi:MAG: hypothetical protein EA425_07845 [Puniceicoccaceae bacterium]|nr:MAG: hypothetical protein EA425_07845 [Puniceicoccaceae bacterium]
MKLTPHTPSATPRPVAPGFEPMGRELLTNRAVWVGFIGTVLFHLLVMVSGPVILWLPEGEMAPEEAREFAILLTDPEEEISPDDWRYVQTNPDVPENPPDRTTNIAARDQQAANPDPVEELSPDRTPATEGDDLPTESIVTGTLEEPEWLQQARQQQQEQPAQEPTPEQQTPTEATPLPGFEETFTELDDNVGTQVFDPFQNPRPVEERVEGERAEDQVIAERVPPSPPVREETARPVRQPQPRLPRVAPTPVRTQPAGVSQTGVVGVDANFSEYGEYLERMVEAVSQRWHRLVNARQYSEVASRVVLEFEITRDGMIENLQTVDTTAHALGTLLTRSAIEQGQSYGAWTMEMAEVLGERQTIRFTFYYR